MTVMILQSKLSKTAYPIITDPALLEKWLSGNWRELDPVEAGRSAYYAMVVGQELAMKETNRSIAKQQVYYAEYQNYLKTSKVGPHGIKLAAVPGTSSHGYLLAFDASNTHPIYHASNATLAKYGLCKPLMSKGEYWHVQPIEVNSNLSKNFKKWAPVDLAPALVAKFGFQEETLLLIRDYQYGPDFAAGLLAGKKDFSNATIDYFDDYRHWSALEAKINIY